METEAKRTKSGVRPLVTALLLIVAVLAASVVGSYVLTISQVNNERTQRQEQRAPACSFAKHLIDREAPSLQRGDAALYNATGCPKILKVTG